MSFFKKLFDAQEPPAPIEPIFPGEDFVELECETVDGPAAAFINKAYNGYPNKRLYGYQVLVELEAIYTDDEGYATENDTVRLNRVEQDVIDFLKSKQVVHLVGRVNRKNFRDLLIYIDEPRLEQEEVNQFCDEVMKERGINFAIEEDEEWNAVGGFLN
ncbi:DUF695 domain-containing protein [Filimonas lacunae]|nr:DUF695 domain-containing protein [Filimonas lacunae]BAV09449.1 hypothetical protein FLA_5498 [Filimonas lacunae]